MHLSTPSHQSKTPLATATGFKSRVVVQHMESGPSPDTASFIQKIEEEKLAKERGETKDNRKDNCKDNCKENRKENRKDNCKDNRKDICKDNRKDNCKDNRKDNCKDSHKDNYKDNLKYNHKACECIKINYEEAPEL